MISKIIYHKDLVLVSIRDPKFKSQFKESITENLHEITACTLTLQSSSKLLDFTVNDMLTLAQIESSKFRLNVVAFDIREAVKEVMDIQMEKATFNRIRFSSQFKGFEDGYVVSTDEMRVKQILLNL